MNNVKSRFLSNISNLFVDLNSLKGEKTMIFLYFGKKNCKNVKKPLTNGFNWCIIWCVYAYRVFCALFAFVLHPLIGDVYGKIFCFERKFRF